MMINIIMKNFFSLITIILINIIILFILSSCKEKHNEYIILKKVKSQDYVLDNEGNQILLHNISSIKKIDDSFLIVDRGQTKIFLTDLNLNIQKIFDFTDLPYLIIGEILDAILFDEGILYYIDKSWNIKQFNNVTNEVKTIGFEHNIHRMRKFPYRIEKLSNLEVLISYALFSPDKTLFSDYFTTIGGLYSPDGKLKTSFEVNLNESCISIPGDFTYPIIYHDIIFFYFWRSACVFVFDKSGNRINTFTKNEEELFEKGITNRRQTKPGSGGKSFGRLFIENENIFCFHGRGTNDEVKLSRYDIDFNLISKYKTNELLPGTSYNIIVVDENRFFFAASGPFDPNIIHEYAVK